MLIAICFSGYLDVRPPPLLSAIRYRIVSIRSLLLGLAVVLLLVGCAQAPHHRGVAGKQAQTCAAGSYDSYASPRLAYAAVVIDQAVARRRPHGPIVARFGRLNRNKLPMVFGVRGALLSRRCEPTWYRVQLPIRPNGTVGWVSASAVTP